MTIKLILNVYLFITRVIKQQDKSDKGKKVEFKKERHTMIIPHFDLKDLPVGDSDCLHEVRKVMFIELNDDEAEGFFECSCVLKDWKGKFEMV